VTDIILLELPASLKYLTMLGACIEQTLNRLEGISQELNYDVQLATHEIAVNIIEHAYQLREGGRIRLKLELDGTTRTITAELTDTGKPFNLASVAQPNLDEPQEGGYGLFLAQALMDSVTYDTNSDGNKWRLVKKLQG
jgi:serine/threonine-protein kinase RsbW